MRQGLAERLLGAGGAALLGIVVLDGGVARAMEGLKVEMAWGGAFCEAVARHLGNAPFVREACRENERQASRRARQLRADPELMRACRRFALDAGGSWQALLVCVHWRLAAPAGGDGKRRLSAMRPRQA